MEASTGSFTGVLRNRHRRHRHCRCRRRCQYHRRRVRKTKCFKFKQPLSNKVLKRFKTLITYLFPRLTAERFFSFRFFPFFLICSLVFPSCHSKFKQSAEFERRDLLASSLKADCQKQKPRQWHSETSDKKPAAWLRTNLYA